MTSIDITHNPRFYYVFSYWIFLWFIAYISKIIPYNPKLFLLAALIENLIYLFLMIYYNNSLIYIGLFLFINFFIKVVPLVVVWKTLTNRYDVLFGLILIVLYFIWLKINNVNMTVSFLSSLNGIKHNKPVTPFIYYMNNIIKQLL